MNRKFKYEELKYELRNEEAQLAKDDRLFKKWNFPTKNPIRKRKLVK